MNSTDLKYLDLLREVRSKGTQKSDRTGTGTVSIFGRSLTFNMKEGFPLLTTKKMHTKSIVHELLWFLQGGHNIKYLVDNGVGIWNEWPWQNYMKEHETIKKDLGEAISKADSTGDAISVDYLREKLDSHPALTLEEFVAKIKESPLSHLYSSTKDSFSDIWGELGPVYGKQWRQWQGWMQYKKDDGKTGFGSLWYDQILRLVQQLKTNPDSRRLMVNAWNVAEIDKMTLPPCHYGFQVYTRELSLEERKNIWLLKNSDKPHLLYHPGMVEKSHPLTTPQNWFDEQNIPTRAISLMWQQRSVDLFLGLPFNIASYGLLLEMLAQSTDMVADELIFNGGDCHIYVNHFDQVDEQLSRTTFPLCTLNLTKPNSEYSSLHGNNGHIIEYKYEDIKFEGYMSHPAIKAPIAI